MVEALDDNDDRASYESVASPVTDSERGAAEKRLDWENSPRRRRKAILLVMGYIAGALPQVMVLAIATRRIGIEALAGLGFVEFMTTIISTAGIDLLAMLCLWLPIVGVFTYFGERERTLFDDERLLGIRRRVEADEQLQLTRDDLELSTLWRLNQQRIDYYHELAISQARISFRNSQIAIGLGMLILLMSLGVILFSRQVVSAVAAAAVGAIASGLAGYIAGTFLKIQGRSMNQLRSYFDQPLELFRILAAERLFRGHDEEARRQFTGYVVQSIVRRPESDYGSTPAQEDNPK